MGRYRTSLLSSSPSGDPFTGEAGRLDDVVGETVVARSLHPRPP
jgi:hypothetical protein